MPAAAGGVAEETLGNMRTIASLGAEKRQTELYTLKLVDAMKSGLKKAHVTGAGMACMMFFMFSTYALGESVSQALKPCDAM